MAYIKKTYSKKLKTKQEAEQVETEKKPVSLDNLPDDKIPVALMTESEMLVFGALDELIKYLFEQINFLVKYNVKHINLTVQGYQYEHNTSYNFSASKQPETTYFVLTPWRYYRKKTRDMAKTTCVGLSKNWNMRVWGYIIEQIREKVIELYPTLDFSLNDLEIFPMNNELRQVWENDVRDWESEEFIFNNLMYRISHLSFDKQSNKWDLTNFANLMIDARLNDETDLEQVSSDWIKKQSKQWDIKDLKSTDWQPLNNLPLKKPITNQELTPNFQPTTKKPSKKKQFQY